MRLTSNVLPQKMLGSLMQDPVFPNALLSPGKRTLRAAPAAALHLVLRMLPLDSWARYSQVRSVHAMCSRGFGIQSVFLCCSQTDTQMATNHTDESCGNCSHT